MHTPVLLKEVIQNLQVKPQGLYIDATYGEGGYTREILNQKGRVLALDWDPDQVQKAKSKIQNAENLIIIEGNFADIEEIANKNNFYPVDGIVFDLGLSLDQIKSSGKGLSYNKLDEELDMRLNIETEEKANDLINSLNSEALYEIFSRYSEEINSRPIADAIVLARKSRKINKVSDLIRIIDQVIGSSDRRVYARIFQALRIAVNSELENLKAGLKGAINILKPDGRIAIVSFHSIEDRIVKNYVRANHLKLFNKKVIKGDYRLKFERSAKLRVIGF